jgi:thioesterase domain-containing protein/acyl carrier protein
LPAPATSPPAHAVEHVGPRDELEEQLVKLWRECLGVQQIGIHDDFFRLGGHSLLAVRVFTRLEPILGQRLSPNLLFQAPTIEWLASALREATERPSRSSMTAIQIADSPSFFCLPGAGDLGTMVGELARRIGPQQTVYNVDIDKPGRDRDMPLGVVELAECLVRDLREIQPVGPYLLGGYSYGGVLAFEMARQLHSAGETIALLALIDTFGHNYPARVSRLGREWRHLERMWKLPTSERVSYLFDRFRDGVGRMQRTLRGKNQDPAEAQDEALFGDREVFKAASRATRAYLATSPIYHGTITLFRAMEPSTFIGYRFDDSENGWGPFTTRGVRVVPIAAGHTTILREPGILSLTDGLRACLREAGSR